MTEITHDKIFEEFCDWDRELASKIICWAPWGGTSIVVGLNNGTMYKVKRYASDRFIMQSVSEEDIEKKLKSKG